MPALRILSERLLPPPAERAVDIRWASDTSVVLALERKGLVELPLDPKGATQEWVPAGGRPGGIMGCSRIGLSSSFLAVSPPVFTLGWRARDGRGLQEQAGFDHIADLDVFEDRLLVLAVRRDENRRFAPEGAIAWLGSLRQGLADLRPVLYDRTGPGAKSFAACGAFEMGAVRFLPDGSFLIVPGVQPGIQLYDANGRLLRSWDTGSLGLDTGDCAGLTEREIGRLAIDPFSRMPWLNQRHVVDEILLLSGGPSLVIRSVDAGRSVWRVVQLHRDGPPSVFRLPVPSSGPFEHVRGDVRKERIVLVAFGLELDAKRRRVGLLPSRLLEVALP